MPPRLRDVVALPDLGLVVRVAPPAALDREVAWVAVSELEDPARWLEGGELLLTTGMRLTDDRRSCTRYVARLAAADVTALAIAVGVSHDEIPPALIRAAERAGLPLLEVPRPTPFIAVTKAVSRLVSAEEYDDAARGFAAQRDLIRAALSAEDGGATAVVARLARHVGGFAVQLDPGGRLVHAAPASAAARVTELRPEVARLRPRGLLASAVVATADRHVVIQPLGLRGSARGFLAVGAPRPLQPSDQAVVNLAVSLLSLALSRAEGRSPAEGRLRALAVRLLLAGRGDELPLAALGWEPLTAGAVVVVLARAPGDPEDVERRLSALVPGAAVAVGGVADRPDAVVAVIAAEDAADAGDGLSAAVPGLHAGLSRPVDAADPAGLVSAVSQAAAALVAAEGGAGGPAAVVHHADLPHTGLDALLDPGATRAWAQAALAPLEVRGERADLVGTLRAWLRRHGQVDAAAGDLGVHRHTVRHRLRRAEALLGRSLDDPSVRAELWVALSHVDGAD
jgi:DNA-binding PucR family transcriptional regulator